MEQHNLALNIPDILNTCVIKIEDVSDYSDLLEVTCPLLQITPPGFTFAVHFHDLSELFTRVYNAEDLKLGSAGDPLPDGVYVIRYSVAPKDALGNNKVFIEYNYLRIAVIMNTYYNVLCALELTTCEPDIDIKEKLNELRYIRMLIDGAKSKVEYCHSITEGMDLYNYALKLLNRLDCQTC